MKSLLSHILDFLFPPTPEELTLRELLPHEVFTKLTPAPPPPFPFITSVFAYKDPLVAELVSSIKNKKNTHACRLGAFALHTKLQGMSGTLIPLPLSEKRRRERGYNQSEFLIDEIIRLDSEKKFQKKSDILKRVVHSGEQKLKDREERMQNKNIFSAHFVPISEPLIIIDDVATTGSTLKEARETLLSAGYKDVRAFTLAH